MKYPNIEVYEMMIPLKTLMSETTNHILMQDFIVQYDLIYCKKSVETTEHY